MDNINVKKISKFIILIIIVKSLSFTNIINATDITIAVISPQNEDILDYKNITSIAAEIINPFLYHDGVHYEFQFIHQTEDPLPGEAAIGLETVQSFKSMDANIIIWNGDENHLIHSASSYINENDMFLFSGRSATLSWATMNDNIYRLTTNYKVQSDILTDIYLQMGTKAIFILQDDGSYESELTGLIKSDCETKGIEVLETLRYDRIIPPGEVSEFESSMTYFEVQVEDIENIGYNINEVGVQIISDERDIETLVSYFPDYPILEELTWYGDEATTLRIENSHYLPASTIDIKFYGVKKAPDYYLPEYEMVDEMFYEETSKELGYYQANIYDILRILAEAIKEKGISNMSDIISEVHAITQTPHGIGHPVGYIGVSGLSQLDPNGDRKSEDWDIMSFSIGSGPYRFGRYGYYNQMEPDMIIKRVNSLWENPNPLYINIIADKIYPVQSAWNPNVNGDAKFDLVSGKEMAVIVKTLADTDPEPLHIEITFQGQPYVLEKSNYILDGHFLFANCPIPVNPATGSIPIDGKIVYKDGTVQTLTSGWVEITNMPDLKVRYYHVGSTSYPYGKLDYSDYLDMVQNANLFLTATYPCQIDSESVSSLSYSSFHINGNNDYLDDLFAINNDILTEDDGDLGRVGVGIVPANDGVKDYFTFHNHAEWAGVYVGGYSNAVLCLDDYYVSVAHEVAHTFAISTTPEQWVEFNYPDGIKTTGVWVDRAEWITALDIMGSIPKQSFCSWIYKDTYESLFSNISDPGYDPEIYIANGVISKDGTVIMEPSKQYRLPQGYPSTLSSGNYTLQFLNMDGRILGTTPFTTEFYAYVTPKEDVRGNVRQFSKFKLDLAPFSFATIYPNGTHSINLVDIRDSKVLSSVLANEINERLHADAGRPISTFNNTVVMLDASGSYSPYGDISHYEWDCDNDGEFDDASGKTTDYTWKNVGEYRVRLKVSDDEGRIDIDSIEVQVSAQDKPTPFDPRIVLIGIVIALISIIIIVRIRSRLMHI